MFRSSDSKTHNQFISTIAFIFILTADSVQENSFSKDQFDKICLRLFKDFLNFLKKKKRNFFYFKLL